MLRLLDIPIRDDDPCRLIATPLGQPPLLLLSPSPVPNTPTSGLSAQAA